MNQLPKSPTEEYDELEKEFSSLFNGINSPKLSRSKKHAIINNITGSKWQIPKFVFVSMAMATAAFIIIVGMAQISQPGNVLYNLKIGNKTNQVINVTPEILEQANKAVEEKKAEVDTLVKTNAESEIIKKAQSDLKKAQQKQQSVSKELREASNNKSSEIENENEDIECEDDCEDSEELNKSSNSLEDSRR